MRKRLSAVVEVLKWAEPFAWEDDDDDDGQPSVLVAPRATGCVEGARC